ncbi:MAG: hypothetical protein GC208_08705 [Alphaproteobacteria bacterium]|nr:hypothetical protein [Alphaproteobacteria bacterium]
MLARWFFRYALAAPVIAFPLVVAGYGSEQSWLLAVGIGVWFSITLVIFGLWFFADRGDGRWPFAPSGKRKPLHYGPEVRYGMAVLLAGLGVLLLVAGLASFATTGLDPERVAQWESRLWQPVLAVLILFPIVFVGIWFMSVFWIGLTRGLNAKLFLPKDLRERRARFYENWPNVDGWG